VSQLQASVRSTPRQRHSTSWPNVGAGCSVKPFLIKRRSPLRQLALPRRTLSRRHVLARTSGSPLQGECGIADPQIEQVPDHDTISFASAGQSTGSPSL
jgi:hypothetical protein